MHTSLQELTGEVARLRRECDYLTDVLGRLENLSGYPVCLTEEQGSEISHANYRYARSVGKNVEHATNDLRNWLYAVEQLIECGGPVLW